MKLNRSRGPALRWLWIVALCVIVWGSLLPDNSTVMRAVGALPVSDKVIHFSAYLVLAVLPVLAIRRRTTALWAALSMILLGLLLELGQNFVPGRSPEVADEVANSLGVACGILIGLPFRAPDRATM